MNTITQKLSGELRQIQHMAASQVATAQGITLAGAVDEIHRDPTILDQLAEHARSLGGGASVLADQFQSLKSAVAAAKPAPVVPAAAEESKTATEEAAAEPTTKPVAAAE
jgi:hypothetical protein